MKSCRQWLPWSAAAVFISLAIAVGAQPFNDRFVDRTVIFGSDVTVTGTLAGASSEFNEPGFAGISSGQTAWWSWIAPSNGLVALSIEATSFFAFVEVYTGPDLSSLS